MATFTIVLPSDGTGIEKTDEIDIEPYVWFDFASEDERKEMYEMCKEHFQKTAGMVSDPPNT